MSTKAKYEALIEKLRGIEKETDSYLSDTCVDAENVYFPESHPDYYSFLISAAMSAAIDRADDEGVDLESFGIKI